MPSDMRNANFPMDADGHTYHVGLKRGEICNRVLTVGDPERARSLATLLDADAPCFERHSHRGFLTITGRFQGVPVSIIAIGMGMAMMDFMLREVRAVVDGPMCVIRIGTCGSIASHAQAGDLIVPDGSAAVTRNFDAFSNVSEPADNGIAGSRSAAGDHYHLTRVSPADSTLADMLRKSLAHGLVNEKVLSGLNITADTFYASQGRVDSAFIDNNVGHIERIQAVYPAAVSLEMENYMLFHLAQCAAPLADIPSIRAASVMIVVFQRQTNTSLAKSDLVRLEAHAGRAVLGVLAKSLTDVPLHAEHGSVWAKAS